MYDNSVKFSHAVNLAFSPIKTWELASYIENSLIEVSKKFLKCLSSVQRYFEVLVCYFLEVGSFQGTGYRWSDRSKLLALHNCPKITQEWNCLFFLYFILLYNLTFSRVINILKWENLFFCFCDILDLFWNTHIKIRIHFIRVQCYSR